MAKGLEFRVMEVQDNDFTLVIGDLIASRMAIDECLGCVASILYRGKPTYAQTYESWVAVEKARGDYGSYSEAIAQLVKPTPMCG